MMEEDKYLNAFRKTLPVLINKEMNKVRNQHRRLILLVCVLLGVNVLVLGGTVCVLWSSAKTSRAMMAMATATTSAEVAIAVPETEKIEEQEVEEEVVFVKEDIGPPSSEKKSNDRLTVAAERAANLAAEHSEAKQEIRRADIVRNKVEQQKKEPQIPDYVTTEKGMTLRSLARRYYGSNVFWVCIYDRNKEALSSPDALPLGIRLSLPRPEDYGIDVNDPSSLQRARKLGQDLKK